MAQLSLGHRTCVKAYAVCQGRHPSIATGNSKRDDDNLLGSVLRRMGKHRVIVPDGLIHDPLPRIAHVETLGPLSRYVEVGEARFTLKARNDRDHVIDSGPVERRDDVRQ